MGLILFILGGLIIFHIVDTAIKKQHIVQPVATLSPVFFPPGGYYDRSVQLTLTLPGTNDGAMSHRILFTTDGSVPTTTVGTTYTHPIHLSAATSAVTVIRARAVLPDATLGPVVSASYFVGVQATLPMLSLIVDPADLWDPDSGLYTNPYMRGDVWERPVDITYVDRDRDNGFHIPAGLRIHGQWSRSFAKKSLRLYFRQDYGVGRLEYPLFDETTKRPTNPEQEQSFKRLILHNGGQDWPRPHTNWTLIRNQLAANLAFEHGACATRSQPALLFINGEPWGIYQIRERLDEHFLADQYGIKAADYLETPELTGQREIHMGDSEAWDHLMHFIAPNDLAEAQNYAYVQTQVDIADFIDYWALQIYAGNIDWPHHNVEQFRPRVPGGRWHWIFWDSDHGFAANLYSQVDTNMITRLLDYDHPETGGRDVRLFRKLLENPTFRDQFLSRIADLLNTTLTPQSVLAHIEALANEIQPDIAYERIRWASSIPWESSIQELRDFARRRPDFVRQHVVERFNLEGTTELTLDSPISGHGYIAVNNTLIQDLPWQGTYFSDIALHLIAAPEPGYRFVGWVPDYLPQTPSITVTAHTAQHVMPKFEPLAKDSPRPGDVVFTGYASDPDGQSDFFELRVMRPGGVDIRGWRVTDNDTKTATDEGSLIFSDHPAFTRVPRGTTLRIIITPKSARDDLNAWDRQIVLYTSNGQLDTETDPMFHLGPHDNLVLLAPGPTEALDDDQGIALVSTNEAVTPASFGVLSDGVLANSTLHNADTGYPDENR